MNPSTTDLKTRFLAERAALHPHPDRVQDSLFRTAAFFDPRDLIQVRYEMVRRSRLDGKHPTQVARAFGVSRQLVHLWTRAFQADGLLGLFPRQRGPKAAHKCTAEVLSFIQTRRVQAPHLTLDDLLAEVRHHCGVCLHRRTLERHLAALGKKLRCHPSPLLRSVPRNWI